ncbi:MAG TPA: universal stress protein [Terriglobales bacterium]|jgi:nucleotide-binding universal stress UspA family protein|nr:universal stress protein [Terriglobales bacterium]
MTYISLTARLRLPNVVLATDFSDASKAALGYAAAIARVYQGKVYAVHVIPPEVYWWVSPESLPKVEEGVEESARQQMGAVLSSEQLRDVPHEGIIKHGEIWDGLQPVIGQHNADVVVAGTRGRRGLQKLVMGSVAEEILRLSPVPVLTVHPEAAQTSPPEPRTILFPTDFSTDSMRALAYALSLAQEFQACMIFLHVAPSMHNDPEVRTRLQTFFTDQLRQIVPAETQTWGQQQLVVEFGDPSQAILQCADAYKAELIVMGVRGAGSMVRAATHFGSTAYRVISQARAPVFSVRQFQQDIIRTS